MEQTQSNSKVCVAYFKRRFVWNNYLCMRNLALISLFCACTVGPSYSAQAGSEHYDTTLLANTGSVPLQSSNALLLNTLLQNSNLKASVRKRLTKGMSIEALLDYEPSKDDKDGIFGVNEKIVLSGEANPIDDTKIAVDVSFHFPSNVVGVAGRAQYKNYQIKADYDTKNMLKSLGGASYTSIKGRKISLEPSHNFTNGRFTLNVEGELNSPNSESSATLSIKSHRDRDGSMDALIKLQYTFNKGKDIFSPSISAKDKNVSYHWEHKFTKGGRVKAQLNELKKLSLEWFDPSLTGGQWIMKTSFPIVEPQQGKVSFMREMNF